MMKKTILAGALALFVSNSTFAGGLLTNTNQHAAFLRMLSRGATTDVDAALSNPAGLAFSPEGGFRMGLSIQSAYQTRNIDASYNVDNYGLYEKYYKGTASAPVIPSLFAAYTKDKWTLSGFFAITAGGGKASFDEGLPMFESAAMAKFNQAGLAPSLYDISSSMDGRQYIYAVQLGLTYKINDNLAVFAGGRMNYFSGGYKGYLNFKLKDGMTDYLAAAYAQQFMAAGYTAEQAAAAGAQAAAQVDNTVSNSGVALDCDQTGWGITPVIGFDAKVGRWLFGAKYEFKTNLNIENKTKENTDPDGSLAAFKHGVNTPSDIPSLLSVAARYEFLKNLRASVEYHFYDDKHAHMADEKQQYLTKGTNEYLAGIEWDVTPLLTLSCGAQITDYGLSDGYQRDTSFSCDSYTLGLGAKLNLSEKLALNVGYMWTNYEDYTMTTTNYNSTGLSGTNVYSRTNKVFGVSVDYHF
jgi:long-chain fatty acid transport protein